MADEPELSELESANQEAAKFFSNAGLEEEMLTVASQETVESPSDVEKKTGAIDEETKAPEFLSDAGSEAKPLIVADEPEILVLPRANQEALEFLSRIGEDELLLNAFSESLDFFSDTGIQVGEFRVVMQPVLYKEEEDCYLVHITSQCTINDVSCHSSVLAYISKKLETLEQRHQEYIKMENHYVNKKIHIEKRGDKLFLERDITEGEYIKHLTTSYSWSSMEGFVSEASNLLILRILARERVIPKNMIFLAFDAERNLCESTYNELGLQKQTIGNDTVDVFGIERSIQSEADLPMTWQYYFLADGHLSSHVQVGSPVTMKLLNMPILIEKEEIDLKPRFEKQLLEWETDAQLSSQFLHRKEELNADHASYIRHHPEMRLLLSDFLQFLLLRKPEDIITFAAEFFAPFSAARPRRDTFRSSNKSSPFRNAS